MKFIEKERSERLERIQERLKEAETPGLLAITWQAFYLVDCEYLLEEIRRLSDDLNNNEEKPQNPDKADHV